MNSSIDNGCDNEFAAAKCVRAGSAEGKLLKSRRIEISSFVNGVPSEGAKREITERTGVGSFRGVAKTVICPI
jgi:hypothetical protein